MSTSFSYAGEKKVAVAAACLLAHTPCSHAGAVAFFLALQTVLWSGPRKLEARMRTLDGGWGSQTTQPFLWATFRRLLPLAILICSRWNH